MVDKPKVELPEEVIIARRGYRRKYYRTHKEKCILKSLNWAKRNKDRAKKAMDKYLENNPELLTKIAEFYPVEVLAEKLATTVEEPLPKTDFPDVVSIEDLKDNTRIFKINV
jgi:hypothetical protein